MKSRQTQEQSSSCDPRTLTPPDPLLDSRMAITLLKDLKHRMAVEKALDVIRCRTKDLPAPSELAAHSGVSRTYFSHIFKEVTGLKLQEYLVQVRIKKAQELLENAGLNIKQIAFKAGFKDPHYFCRMFKKRVGMSPTDWRIEKDCELLRGDAK